MTIRVRQYPSGLVTYSVDLRHGGKRYRVQCPKGTTSRRKAEAFERTLLADIRAGVDPRETPTNQAAEALPTPTLAAYAPTYLGEVKAAGQRESTIANKESLLRVWILPTLGHVQVSDFRTSHFATLREVMSAGGLGAGRVNSGLAVLSAVVRFYHDRRDLPAPHFRVGRVKGENTKAVKRWTDPEAAKLVAAATAESSNALVAILLGLDAGMRLSEIRALQWTDIDLTGRRAMITVERSRGKGNKEGPTKGGKARHVPMTPRLAAALGAQVRATHDPHVLLAKGGVPYGRAQMARLGVKVVKSASIPKAGFHTLRHTFCSRLAERGVDVNKIRLLAGHASLAVTQKYMWLSPNGLDVAIDALVDPEPATAA